MGMNGIWAGLILISIVFAIGADVHDIASDTHQNNKVYTLDYSPIPDDQDSYQFSYRANAQEYVFKGHLRQMPEQYLIRVSSKADLPEPWRYRFRDKGSPELLVIKQDLQLLMRLPEVYWQRLDNMMQAAFDMAEFAAKLALGLIGLMALWLGLMKIAEQSGLVNVLVKWIQPLLVKIFPDVPKDHPAMGAISLNMAANMLGLGNAATPMGIKAMEYLQTLNKTPDRASDSMCMFLALNTSSVQLIPPVTVIALLGTQASGLFVSILLATLCSTVVAYSVARWYSRREHV